MEHVSEQETLWMQVSIRDTQKNVNEAIELGYTFRALGTSILSITKQEEQ